MLRYFRELRMIISSLVGSLRTLVWLLLFLTLIVWVLAIAVTSRVTGYVRDHPELDGEGDAVEEGRGDADDDGAGEERAAEARVQEGHDQMMITLTLGSLTRTWHGLISY